MQPLVTQPLVFEPYFRPQIWGGRWLQQRLGKALPAAGAFGESWEISAHPHHISRVAEGPFRGAPLTDLWREHGQEILGRAPSQKFPLLVKYLDCRDLLSVQVHPDDATARALLGDELGKTEAWVVLHAEPTARIYAGLKQGVGRAELERCLPAGAVGECLHGFTPRGGDCLLLPAGTVHAVGGGVLIAEVQQSSDATFRLFDWNRVGPDGQPRTLHWEQSLAAIDWGRGPVAPVPGSPLPGGGEALVACPYFELRRYPLTGSFACPPAVMTIWLVLAGTAELRAEGGYARLCAAGEAVLVPATAQRVAWRGEATLLAASVPAADHGAAM